MYVYIVLYTCRADILINTAKLPNADDGQISEDPPQQIEPSNTDSFLPI